jgi:hypothetical protein
MIGSARLLGLPLVLTACGCLSDGHSPGAGPGVGGPFSSLFQKSEAPRAPAATEETAKRVAILGEKILAANPQIRVHPLFQSVGRPEPTIFHPGANQIIITEGLVRECKTEGQLAAVLCQELGRIESERLAEALATAQLMAREPPPAVTVGNEVGGRFGEADGTRRAELAKFEQKNPRPGSIPPQPLAPPDTLARTYLQKAGFRTADLDEVTPLLRKAERNTRLEKQMSDAAANRS